MKFFDDKPYVKKFNDLLILRDLTHNTGQIMSKGT